mgnify:CR=1 FL=1
MNNTDIFNGALNGFIQGASNNWIQAGDSADYQNLTATAVAFATAVDSLIPFDPEGDPVFGQVILCICAGVMGQRYTAATEAQSSNYWLPIAAKIVALYYSVAGEQAG